MVSIPFQVSSDAHLYRQFWDKELKTKTTKAQPASSSLWCNKSVDSHPRAIQMVNQWQVGESGKRMYKEEIK